jgi:hypothetical protein
VLHELQIKAKVFSLSNLSAFERVKLMTRVHVTVRRTKIENRNGWQSETFKIFGDDILKVWLNGDCKNIAEVEAQFILQLGDQRRAWAKNAYGAYGEDAKVAVSFFADKSTRKFAKWDEKTKALAAVLSETIADMSSTLRERSGIPAI